MSETVQLVKTLISKASVTPDDAGCQTLLATRLAAMGFTIESMRFAEVDNLWARLGDQAPLLVFAGHTDVVPPGPQSAWQTDPFTPTIIDEYLYGRGAVDMKTGVAAKIVATENFLKKNPDFTGSIAFLITSDEEGPSINGTKKVIEALTARGEKIDYCIIGEASSEKAMGDQIRIGRRGSFHGDLRIKGKQGHVANPQHALNPIHAGAAALAELAAEHWDEGNEFFPPTTFQITNISSGTGATNVIPGDMNLLFNLRFGTAITIEQIKARIETILQKHGVNYDISWSLSGEPFLTKRGKLISAAQAVLKQVTGFDVVLSTGGGTSDGRFIAPTGAEVVEIGPINATAHHTNECIKVTDIDKLTAIYEGMLEYLLRT